MAEQEILSRPPGTAGRGPREVGMWMRALRQPGFIPCVALLASLAAGFHVLTAEVQFKKEALRLRKPLDQLDQQKLFPYKLLSASTLKPEMVDTLGTDQYISWTLEDTTVKSDSPERIATLFITYYTGTPDQVPHVPEVCYLSSGYRESEASFRSIPMPTLGADFTMPVQVIEFERSHLLGRDSRVVMYTFQANGQFAPSRRDVQSVLSNPRDRFAYFSKLEISFGTQEQMPVVDAAVKAGERLFQVVVPILLKEHWPDWKAANEAARHAASSPAKAENRP